MPTPAEQALAIAREGVSPRGQQLLDTVLNQTRLFGNRMRTPVREFPASEILQHDLQSHILQAKLTDHDFLLKLAGRQLVDDMKRLPAHIKTVGFPVFELPHWPQTLGQLYAVTMTPMQTGLMRQVYGFDSNGERCIERALSPFFEKQLTDPTFQTDTIAVQTWLALLKEYRIPPLVAIGGLEVLSSAQFLRLGKDNISTHLSQGMKNTASQLASSHIEPSDFERNQALTNIWLTNLQKLHGDLSSAVKLS